MKRKSLGINYIFNTLKTLMGVIFPLITFPYVSRILGPDGLGKVDYAQSVVSYFVLIASFGIYGYAVREGARLRDDKEKLNTFCSEILAVNLMTVGIAYVLFLLVLGLPKFGAYRSLLLLFSISIPLNVISLDWLYNIFEEYRYITIRSFIFQLISLGLLFILVRLPDDYIWYAFILVVSSVGSNILNFIRARRYIRIRFGFGSGLKRHLRPMFLIFILNIASSIYLIMDRTMLGYITENDTEVGLYAAAIKIHAVVISVMTSLRVIMTPRVAYHMQHDRYEADRLSDFTMKATVLLALPCAAGIFLLSARILSVLAGREYEDAISTLQILMIDLVFAALNGVMVNMIFITRRMDRQASAAVMIGALVNLISNAVTIPLWGRIGAACSTVVSELAIFLFVCICGRKAYQIRRVLKQVLQSAAACVLMAAVVLILRRIGLPDIVSLLICIGAGALAYLAGLLVMKNDLALYGVKEVRKRIRRRTV